MKRFTSNLLLLLACLGLPSLTALAQNATESADDVAPAESNQFKFDNELFSAPTIVMVGDQPLNTAANKGYPSPAMYDVDGDGKVELVLGDIFGALLVYENENEGSGDPVWSAFEPLKSHDGEEIEVSNW